MAPVNSAGSWLALLLCLAALTPVGCTDREASSSSDAPTVVTTVPVFAMILQPVMDGRATVETLLASGASPHSYGPTPSDMRSVERGLVLVYGSASLDGWAADLSDDRTVSLMDLLPPDARLYFDRTDEPQSVGGRRVDPHFWTNPKAVSALLPVLADTLCALDGAGCATYRSNVDAFRVRLDSLDARIERHMAPVQDEPVVLARPFFRYFLDRYGPRLVGIVSHEPSTHPTPHRMLSVRKRARETGAHLMLVQRGLSDRPAQVVAKGAGLSILELDVMGGKEGHTTYRDLLLDMGHSLRQALDVTSRPVSGSAVSGFR